MIVTQEMLDNPEKLRAAIERDILDRFEAQMTKECEDLILAGPPSMRYAQSQS